jgi:hypothetical protein
VDDLRAQVLALATELQRQISRQRPGYPKARGAAKALVIVSHSKLADADYDPTDQDVWELMDTLRHFAAPYVSFDKTAGAEGQFGYYVDALALVEAMAAGAVLTVRRFSEIPRTHTSGVAMIRPDGRVSYFAKRRAGLDLLWGPAEVYAQAHPKTPKGD